MLGFTWGRHVHYACCFFTIRGHAVDLHPLDQALCIEPSKSFILQELGACSKTKLVRNRKWSERPLPRVHSVGVWSCRKGWGRASGRWRSGIFHSQARPFDF